jgi:hypothetical protein
MSTVVMDALSHQAIRELGNEVAAYGNPPEQSGRWRGSRLTALTTLLASRDSQLTYAEPTSADLTVASALIVASRSQLHPFSDTDISSIDGFVTNGGGLLLMANHRGFIKPQQQLATALALPLAFNDISIVSFPPIVTGTHPLCAGTQNLRVRNTASLRPLEQAETLAWFAGDPAHVFAVACRHGKGRVVVTGDSGFMASKDDTGADLFSEADNSRFLANILDWLLDG